MIRSKGPARGATDLAAPDAREADARATAPTGAAARLWAGRRADILISALFIDDIELEHFERQLRWANLLHHSSTNSKVRNLPEWARGNIAETLVRMGRGKMMGVDHNKGLRWVGASAGLIANRS